MELNEYQDKAMETCMDTCNNFSYMMLNLVGELGELSSKVAKAIRKGYLNIYDNDVVLPAVLSNGDVDPKVNEYLDELFQELQLEAGDILWELSGLCYIFGWRLNEIGQMNLDKLQSRKERGVIDGNGDLR